MHRGGDHRLARWHVHAHRQVARSDRLHDGGAGHHLARDEHLGGALTGVDHVVAGHKVRCNGGDHGREVPTIGARLLLASKWLTRQIHKAACIKGDVISRARAQARQRDEHVAARFNAHGIAAHIDGGMHSVAAHRINLDGSAALDQVLGEHQVERGFAVLAVGQHAAVGRDELLDVRAVEVVFRDGAAVAGGVACRVGGREQNLLGADLAQQRKLVSGRHIVPVAVGARADASRDRLAGNRQVQSGADLGGTAYAGGCRGGDARRRPRGVERENESTAGGAGVANSIGLFDQDALGAVATDAGEGGARAVEPAGAAVQAVLPSGANFQPGDVQGAGVGDGVDAARARVCDQLQAGCGNLNHRGWLDGC